MKPLYTQPIPSTIEDDAYTGGFLRFDPDFPDSWGLSSVAGRYIRELPGHTLFTAAELNSIHDHFARGWYAAKEARRLDTAV